MTQKTPAEICENCLKFNECKNAEKVLFCEKFTPKEKTPAEIEKLQKNLKLNVKCPYCKKEIYLSEGCASYNNIACHSECLLKQGIELGRKESEEVWGKKYMDLLKIAKQQLSNQKKEIIEKIRMLRLRIVGQSNVAEQERIIEEVFREELIKQIILIGTDGIDDALEKGK